MTWALNLITGTHVVKFRMVIIRVSVVVMKHHNQTKLEKKGILAYTSTSKFVFEGIQDRNFNKAGT